MKPRLLDLYCGAGGAGMGYHQAGFDVVGVDLEDRNYPFEFHQADALAFLAEHGEEFDVIHASPPCHDHSALSSLSGLDGTGDLLTDTLDALRQLGKPWVVENVEGARKQMPGALMLCGSEFDLRVEGGYLRRHRLFLSSEFLWGAGGCAHGAGTVLGVYGTGGGGNYGRGTKATIAEARRLMEITWGDHKGVSLAIPPAYTRFIGGQLIEALGLAP